MHVNLHNHTETQNSMCLLEPVTASVTTRERWRSFLDGLTAFVDGLTPRMG